MPARQYVFASSSHWESVQHGYLNLWLSYHKEIAFGYKKTVSVCENFILWFNGPWGSIGEAAHKNPKQASRQWSWQMA